MAFLTFAGLATCSYLIGLLSGVAFGWRNHYGICCWLCMAIMVFWVALLRNREITTSIFLAVIEGISSVLGLVISIEIVAFGHLGSWIKSTFGTGGYQAWHYNSAKSYFLYDVDFSFTMLIQAGIGIAYVIKIFKNRGTVETLKIWNTCSMQYGKFLSCK